LVGGLAAALLYSAIFFFNESPKEELSREGVLERGGQGGLFGKGRGEQRAGTGTGRTGVTTSG